MQVFADGNFTVSDMANQDWTKFKVQTNESILPRDISGATGWRLTIKDTTASGNSKLTLAVSTSADTWQQSTGVWISAGDIGTAYLDITGPEEVYSYSICFQSFSEQSTRSYLVVPEKVNF